MDNFFDRYAWNARRGPAMMVVAPLTLGLLAWVPDMTSILGPLVGITANAGILPFVTQFVRDAGKKAEVELFRAWGAMPSVALLRHRDGRIDPITKLRYHQTLARLIPGIQLPTPEEEARDPEAADQVYTSCSKYLLGATRDPKQFDLLLNENIAYGMRRNLFGSRTAGEILAVMGLLICCARVVLDAEAGKLSVLPIACASMCFTLAYIWISGVTAVWVRQAADTYAMQLLASLDRLAPGKEKKSK